MTVTVATTNLAGAGSSFGRSKWGTMSTVRATGVRS